MFVIKFKLGNTPVTSGLNALMVTVPLITLLGTMFAAPKIAHMLVYSTGLNELGLNAVGGKQAMSAVGTAASVVAVGAAATGNVGVSAVAQGVRMGADAVSHSESGRGGGALMVPGIARPPNKPQKKDKEGKEHFDIGQSLGGMKVPGKISPQDKDLPTNPGPERREPGPRKDPDQGK